MSTRQKAILTFREEDFSKFRTHLLQEDKLERQAFCLAGISKRANYNEILIHKLIFPEDSEYRIQSNCVVDVKPEFLVKILSEFNSSGATGILHANSHPFTKKASFSVIDNNYLPGEIRSLRNFLAINSSERKFCFSRLVYGSQEDGFYCEVYNSEKEFLGDINEIKVIGRSGIKRIKRSATVESGGETLSEKELERLDRHIRWLGEDGQRRIRDTHLVICGLGGIGSVVLANAKGLGFKKLTLIDPDRVELSNLNRLIGAELNDVGSYKVSVMEREIKKVDPDAEVLALPCGVESEEAHKAILEGDVIVSGLDNLSSRFEVQIIAARYLKTLLDVGSGISLKDDHTIRDIGGQIILYYPGGPCLACQGLPIFEATSGLIEKVRRAVGYVRGTEITPPSVVTINSVLGGAAMHTLVRYLVGLPIRSTYIRYDLLNEKIEHYNFQKKEDCPVCGGEGAEGKGDEIEEIPLSPRLDKGLKLEELEINLVQEEIVYE